MTLGHSPAFAQALQLFRSWARRHYGRDWEDAVQDGIVRVLEAWKTLPDDVSVPYLLCILRRGASNGRRKQWGFGASSRPQRLLYASPATLARLAGHDARSEVPLGEWGDLQRAFARLPSFAQHCLRLWIEGYGPLQIAEIMHVSQPYVTKILYTHAPAWKSWHQGERRRCG